MLTRVHHAFCQAVSVPFSFELCRRAIEQSAQMCRENGGWLIISLHASLLGRPLAFLASGCVANYRVASYRVNICEPWHLQRIRRIFDTRTQNSDRQIARSRRPKPRRACAPRPGRPPMEGLQKMCSPQIGRGKGSDAQRHVELDRSRAGASKASASPGTWVVLGFQSQL